jgi:predicted alpha/beta superfamily hydrolase
MSQERLLPETQVKSRYLGTNRTIRVYLPPSYFSERRRRYPVLYLHDGQNVFSSAGTDCCFGWGSWNLDKIADQLATSGKIREIIMVAVDNSRFRYQEYRGLTAATEDKTSSRYEQYARFLARELKPEIDRSFRTLSSARSTAIMGSSLGGICSLTLAWQYPKVFGAAASLSGSYQIEKQYFLRKVLGPYKQKPKPIRIYLDSGTIDETGDDDGRAETEAVVAELRRIGWKKNKLEHYVDPAPLTEPELERAGLRRDKWHEAERSQHNEFYWRMRVWRPLRFLFGKE